MGKINISADYRVDQSMANFKLRVRISQQKSLLAELFGGETRDSSFVECEDTIIFWQEKIFSPFEIKLYQDISNCINDVQKKYHEEIISKNITKGSRLYTYTQNDYMFYKNKNPVTKEGFQSFLSLKNELALPSIMQNMKPFTERYNKKMISESSYDTWIRRNHYLYKDGVVMYVMVDLTSKDEAFHDMEDSEVLLCTVTFDKTRKILTIDPDFSFNEPYTIDKIFMNFDYWIEHVSCGQIPQEIQPQKKFLRHISFECDRFTEAFLTLKTKNTESLTQHKKFQIFAARFLSETLLIPWFYFLSLLGINYIVLGVNKLI